MLNVFKAPELRLDPKANPYPCLKVLLSHTLGMEAAYLLFGSETECTVINSVGASLPGKLPVGYRGTMDDIKYLLKDGRYCETLETLKGPVTIRFSKSQKSLNQFPKVMRSDHLCGMGLTYTVLVTADLRGTVLRSDSSRVPVGSVIQVDDFSKLTPEEIRAGVKGRLEKGEPIVVEPIGWITNAIAYLKDNKLYVEYGSVGDADYDIEEYDSFENWWDSVVELGDQYIWHSSVSIHSSSHVYYDGIPLYEVEDVTLVFQDPGMDSAPWTHVEL